MTTDADIVRSALMNELPRLREQQTLTAAKMEALQQSVERERQDRMADRETRGAEIHAIRKDVGSMKEGLGRLELAIERKTLPMKTIMGLIAGVLGSGGLMALLLNYLISKTTGGSP